MAIRTRNAEKTVTNVTSKKNSQSVPEIKALNERLVSAGMLPLELVSPNDCVGADLNARYMPIETMRILTENIKSDGRLESVPLVYVDDKLPAGKYRIISGHHRIEAAKNAGVQQILVMVALPQDADDVVSRQLAHNALVGLDDQQILKGLFDSIEDISRKFASGLSSEIDKISYPALNFKVGSFKTLTLLFLPEDVEKYDEAVEVVGSFVAKADDEIRVSPLAHFAVFKKALMDVKRVENIKSNGVALSRMCELALEAIKKNKENEI